MLKIGADNWLDKPQERNYDVEKHKKERIEQGFSEYDWWNFNSYIMGVVALAVLKFADGNSYFPIHTEDYEDDTLDDYRATCGAIYFALREYLEAEEDWNGDYDMAVYYDEAREAMILFAENLGHWWN